MDVAAKHEIESVAAWDPSHAPKALLRRRRTARETKSISAQSPPTTPNDRFGAFGMTATGPPLPSTCTHRPAGVQRLLSFPAARRTHGVTQSPVIQAPRPSQNLRPVPKYFGHRPSLTPSATSPTRFRRQFEWAHLTWPEWKSGPPEVLAPATWSGRSLAADSTGRSCHFALPPGLAALRPEERQTTLR